MRRLVPFVCMVFLLVVIPAFPAGANERQIFTGTLPVAGVEQVSESTLSTNVVEEGIKIPGNRYPALGSAEDAIERARELFPELIRGRENELQVDYRDDSYEGRTYWYLRWNGRGSGTVQDNFYIGLDAANGELFNFSCQMYSESGSVNGRLITKEEAKQVARSFIRRYHSDKLAQIVFDDSYRVQGSGNDLNLTYSFRWYQVIDGIPSDSNNIYVQVDAITGQVTNFICQWREISPVQADRIVEVDELTEQVYNQLGVYPEYVFGLVGYGVNSDRLPHADLVYRFNTRYHRFSAESGKPVDNHGNEVDWAEARLFDQELIPVPAPARKESGQQDGQKISHSQAKKLAEEFFKKLGFEGRVERSGTSSASGPGYSEEYWNYRVVPDKGQGYFADAGITLSINAAIGEIQRYYNRNAEYPGDKQGEEIISGERALDVARKFVELIYPEALEDMVLRKELTEYYSRGEIPYYNYIWTRLVNGVPYNGDTIRVTVSGYTGEVQSCYRQYRPVESFVSTRGILAREEVLEALKQVNPFKLTYDLIRDPDKGAGDKVLLVYRTDYSYGIDAHTGEKYSGAMDKTEIDSYQAKLQNHWARVSLTLFADSGLLPSVEEFHPDAAVSRRDVLKILGLVGPRYYNSQYPPESPFKDVADNDPDLVSILRAVNSGFVPGGGELRPDDPLTREDMAVWLVNALGYKKVADAPISMTVDFKDAGNISPGKENYVAIVAGLGLMNGDGEDGFRPRDPVTWAELASVVIKAVPELR